MSIYGKGGTAMSINEKINDALRDMGIIVFDPFIAKCRVNGIKEALANRGLAIVPVEATYEQIEAGLESVAGASAVQLIYDAMLKAAEEDKTDES